jgi:uncharacterized protein YegJ (DUF2314 family)
MASTNKKKQPGPATPPRGELDRRGLGALAALVVGLAVVVWLALPKDGDANTSARADGGAALGADGAASGEPARTTAALERLPEATCELAVLTDRPEAEIAQIANTAAVARLLEIRHCGASCDAVKRVLDGHERFEIEVMKAEDYILPPKDSFATIAPGLTPAERASISLRPSAIVVRARGASTVDQLPARAAFAVTAALAEALSGLVYDEVVRRIETSALFAEHVITAPLGQNVFLPKHIAIQLYRQDDGTARLLTLGMLRFGSPDFTLRGAPMELGSSLASVVNVVASQAAAGKTDLPVVVTLAELARIGGHSAAELSRSPESARSVALDTADAERTEGDPDNEMLELIPEGGATREAWTSAAAALFGETPKVVFTGVDKELDGIAARARRELPAARRRFEAGEGALYVKGPFAIPAESRADGGPAEEWMWIEVTSCDAKSCAGLLSNTPGYVTNLASGSEVKVEQARAADWLLRARDGGTTGGESITALRKRAR